MFATSLVRESCGFPTLLGVAVERRLIFCFAAELGQVSLVDWKD